VRVNFFQDRSDLSKVSVHWAESFSEAGEPETGVIESFNVEIDSNYLSIARALENRFGVAAKSDSAIDKETSLFRNKEMNRLFQQHGAMGRASAPQRRSHHHRPVILFKELLHIADFQLPIAD
jgi:hypothetical protein